MAIVAGFTAGTDILVSTTSSPLHPQPLLTRLSGGGYVALWQSGLIAQGQRLSATGAKLGSQFTVDSSTDGTAVTALGNGGFAVTWVDLGSTLPVLVRFYDAGGTPVGADIVASITAQASRIVPDIAQLASGNVVVAWTELDAQGSFELRARVLDSAGAPTGSEIAVASVSTGSQYHPKIAALAGGGFAIAWMDNGVFGSVAAMEVKARLFDASGAPLGAEFVAPSASAGDQGQPVIAALPDGGFVMAWWTTNLANGDGNSYAVKGQIFSAAGARVGGEFLVNTNSVGAQYHPTITVLSGGSFLIGWTDMTGGGADVSGSAFRAQLFDHDGVRIGGELLLPQATAGAQDWGALVARPGGGFAAAWEDSSAVASGGGIAVKVRLFAELGSQSSSASTAESAALAGDVLPAGVLAGRQIATVNGSAAGVGSTVTLASGARLTVNADGTFSYDPNHAFDALPSAASGAVNSAANDTFSYTLSDGTDGSVTVTVNGVASVGDRLEGDNSNNVFYVDDFQDVVVERPGGGTDEVHTSLGSATDFAQMYSAPAEVEIVVGTSSSGQGLWGNNLDNVVLTLGGDDLIVLADPGNLAGAGTGADTVYSGGGNDFIFFGGSFDQWDRVEGGAGFDTVGLLGSYAIAFGENQLVSVEKIAAYTSGDPNVVNDYSFIMADGNVAAGEGLMVVAQSLRPDEHLVFDGSAESSGSFNVRGGHGNDSITGGEGRDQIWGGLGADILKGGGGGDYFEYYNVGESNLTARDTILDFAAGDRINLINIDSDGDSANGDSVFRFLGAGAFTGAAGELRIYESPDHPGTWIVEGDVDGDGAADLSIAVVTAPGSTLGMMDFWL